MPRSSPTGSKVMIGMNMIVESMALGSFNNVYRTTSVNF